MIEAVIFDAGGVLHAYDGELMKEVVRIGLSITPERFNEAWVPLTTKLEIGLLTEEEYWAEFQQVTGSMAELPVESLLSTGFGNGFTVHTEVMGMVESLKAQGFRLAVLSNAVPAHTAYIEQVGLYQLFDERVFSYQVGVKKPHIRAYQAVLDKLGISPQVGVFIDDREENVVAANQIGLNGFLYRTPNQIRENFLRLGIRV